MTSHGKWVAEFWRKELKTGELKNNEK